MAFEILKVVMCVVLALVAPAPAQKSCAEVGVTCLDGRGVLPDSSLGLTEVVWVGPESEHVYVGSPSIWKMSNGSCLASHDFFGKTSISDTIQVFVDHSGNCAGADSQWKYVGNLTGMYWANLFVPPVANPKFPNAVYLVGVGGDDHSDHRAIVIARSLDYGMHWTNTTVLFPGDTTNGLTYHCAPTPVLVASTGHLYRAFEEHGNANAIMMRTVSAVSSQTDLLLSSTWELSASLPFDAATMVPPTWDKNAKFGWQEGNAVEGPDGEIYDILRIDGQTNVTYNKAAAVKLVQTSSSSSSSLSSSSSSRFVFDRMFDFPSTESKFTIRRDSSAQPMYYALTTDVTKQAVAQGTVYARNHLVLSVSDNLFNWTVCSTLVADDTGFTPIDSARYTGFHYVDWVFDGQDILYSIRTGYRGSNTYHNANRLTVKRLSAYADKCKPWQADFTDVGEGWCRPTTGFTAAGNALTDGDCARACMASSTCKGFTNGDDDTQDTSCALYPDTPNATSGTAPFSCYAKK